MIALRVLVTGAGGQLGTEVVRAFSGDERRFSVVACDRSTLDLGSRDSVLSAITSVAPDAVVHCGAWTAVDACENDPDRALAVNALGTRHVQDGCRVAGARLLYVSTDYVFDGLASAPYDEWSSVGPATAYGRSKLGGESEVDPGNTIVRTSWVCGASGSNFVKTMLRLAGERESVSVVDDQVGSPSFTPDLAGVLRDLVVARLPGLYHVTNSGSTSWFGLAQATFAAAGLDPARVLPISTVDYPTPAPRPAYSVLDNAALRLQGWPLLADWHEPLDRLVKELTS
ncbi:MAG: dTDP-4-dehydrorhamnose reductase [Actinomycetota bacterium]|nr:dTDP-4-dehydrorhamnose reductase [Actinomycetota bacterium]